jgi:hypothetical protein
MVMVWCGSTEVYMTETPAHATIESFERASKQATRRFPRA